MQPRARGQGAGRADPGGGRLGRVDRRGVGRIVAYGRRGRLDASCDAVAQPADREQLAAVLEWCARDGLAAIPYGGGSSVVGGVNAENLGACNGAVTVSLQRMNRVLDIDTDNACVHAEAGILGPDLEQALKPHGLGVRHFPQSYFHSTLGGWVATRGAGHFSTGLAKIEDRVRQVGVLLPDGRELQTRALPASSIGPDPNRLWCGSEGVLGVITEASLRCVRLPTQRAAASVGFRRFEDAMRAARELLQGGLQPTQLRILDPYEHMLSAALSGGDGQGALMILSFESTAAPVQALLDGALTVVREHGGQPRAGGGDAGGDDRSQGWRNTFFRQPYIRDALLDHAVISDTFETAVPWSGAEAMYGEVREAVLEVLNAELGTGMVTCRSTHSYSDGLCLYFAFIGPGRREALVEQWWTIRERAARAVLACGGTLSHHHAMGRDHARWAAAEVPGAFRAAVRAAKRELDPAGVMNPGLWFDE